MKTLIRAELLGLRSTRVPWALAGTAVLLTISLAVTSVVNAGTNGAPSIGTAGALLATLGAVARGSAVMLVLGVLLVTGEFRHGTATATFLQTPVRRKVVMAKAAAAALVAAAVATTCLAVVLVAGVPTGAVPPSMLNTDIVLREAGLLLAYPLYAVLGVGLGSLVVHQPLAVMLPLTWLTFVEDLLLHHVPDSFTPWSLGGVSAALANAGDFPRVLPVWVGGAALLGYALLLLLLGGVRITRRTIT